MLRIGHPRRIAGHTKIVEGDYSDDEQSGDQQGPDRATHHQGPRAGASPGEHDDSGNKGEKALHQPFVGPAVSEEKKAGAERPGARSRTIDHASDAAPEKGS